MLRAAASVNGVPIFAQGANRIPADRFPSRMSGDHYRHVIATAAKANTNMLWVWSGGSYQNERFCDLCNEYGTGIRQNHVHLLSILRQARNADGGSARGQRIWSAR